MSDSSPSKILGFFCSAPPQEQEKCHLTLDLSLAMFAFSPPTIPVEGASHYQIKCTVLQNQNNLLCLTFMLTVTGIKSSPKKIRRSLVQQFYKIP
jgi:hypothetical protein